eukprot:3177258-Amphidinium_carterae.1
MPSSTSKFQAAWKMFLRCDHGTNATGVKPSPDHRQSLKNGPQTRLSSGGAYCKSTRGSMPGCSTT